MAPGANLPDSSAKERLVSNPVYKVDTSHSVQQRIEAFFESFRNDPSYKDGWESKIMQRATCISASPERGTMVYEIDVNNTGLWPIERVHLTLQKRFETINFDNKPYKPGAGLKFVFDKKNVKPVSLSS